MKEFLPNLSRSNFWPILLVVLLGFSAYSFMLGGTFKHLDDQASIINNDDIKSFSNTVKILKKPFFEEKYYYRPLVSLSFMAEYHLFGLNPFFYNLVNLLFHLATGIVVFFIVGRIFQDKAISFFVSLLFVIHPIHWEAVSNIAGRSIVLCAFFTMSAFLFYLQSLVKKSKKIFYGLSIICFVLSLLSK